MSTRFTHAIERPIPVVGDPSLFATECGCTQSLPPGTYGWAEYDITVEADVEFAMRGIRSGHPDRWTPDEPGCTEVTRIWLGKVEWDVDALTANELDAMEDRAREVAAEEYECAREEYEIERGEAQYEGRGAW